MSLVFEYLPNTLIVSTISEVPVQGTLTATHLRVHTLTIAAELLHN